MACRLHPCTPWQGGSTNVAEAHLEAAGSSEEFSGEPRSPIDPDPNTCRFYGRCPKGQGNCATMMPELRSFGAGRSVACHHPEVVVRAETATAA